jgi:hypothetical protein
VYAFIRLELSKYIIYTASNIKLLHVGSS